MLGHRRQVVDREREDGAALGGLVVDEPVARLAAYADARLGILHESAGLAAAAVKANVLRELLPLDDAGDRLARRLGRHEAPRLEEAPIRGHRQGMREVIGERARPA